jgi:metal-responsive CopG/Arc/MetJ family transcriptional regulator
MKRATVTIPDDLADALDSYLKSQDAPPALTSVVQSALRQYLADRGFLRERQTLAITPAKKGSGHRDVSQAHDLYLARK